MWGPILTIADIMVAVPILLAANDGSIPTVARDRRRGVRCRAADRDDHDHRAARPASSPRAGPMNFYLGGPLFIMFFLGPRRRVVVGASNPPIDPTTVDEPEAADGGRS